MSVDEEVCASEILSNTWYLDNSAAKHITMSDKNFIEFERFQYPHGIPTANGEVLPALATHDRYGNSRFESTATEYWLKIDVICVLHGTRSKGRGLFKTNMKVIIPKLSIEVNLATSDDSLLQLYHERWGHQDKRHVKSLLNHELNIQVNVQSE
ncbi:hypothetical protein AVEN_262730-1 [Araneus ventricosus]|uniref:GAG-pre-integrase domain-containing protein n=1 Tax=Araneus ventricosus TaxID=182803 RepID=A0A4Y2QTT1_ARAVE|nr:hypothetical protein AVEN_262730-1 [Araneus ventricosus]